jgi:superfamily II DNA or RNA helicase
MSRGVVLRPYQQRLVRVAVSGNTLVMLPTGSGKTLIAAETARLVGGRTLFLVPTIMLVQQQAAAIRAYNLDLGEVVVGEYHGGQALPATDVAVLVTTPKAFHVAQGRGVLGLNWSEFSLAGLLERLLLKARIGSQTLS